MKQEREDRARAGAPTPPSPAPPSEMGDNRVVLQPVEQKEDDENADQSPDGQKESAFIQCRFRGPSFI